MLPENVKSQKDFRMWVNTCVEKRLSRRFEDYMQTRIQQMIEQEVCKKVNLHIPPRIMIDLLRVIQVVDQLPHLQRDDRSATDYAGYTRVSKSIEFGKTRDRNTIFKDRTYRKEMSINGDLYEVQDITENQKQPKGEYGNHFKNFKEDKVNDHLLLTVNPKILRSARYSHPRIQLQARSSESATQNSTNP